MKFAESLHKSLQDVGTPGDAGLLERIRAEIDFASGFAGLFPDKKTEWQGLILKAAELLREKATADIASAVSGAEAIMAPIGEAAKEYTAHCVGHAHIDMNWLWTWPETIGVCHDTFITVNRLMDEFPEFVFSQSQASVYAAMEEYCPEVFEMIKQRLAEGRWETTASMWVEGDKNLASGESLCRHMLYTRRYFKEKFGIPYDAVKVTWEPDTFGHAHTVPSILARGGVTRYYHCRTGPQRWLTWWEGPDGARVLLFLDKAWYNSKMEAGLITPHMLDYVKETGLKDFLHLYGVGDHGGGPTRRDLSQACDMMAWPVYPTIRLSTTDGYFTAVEQNLPADLPVYCGELNTIFEGCYTSESNIKFANRLSEILLPEAEALSIIAGAAAGFPYPVEDMRKGWRATMFNQFHDILPGSGIHATYDYSQGLFQEIQSLAGMAKTRALQRLVSKVNTVSLDKERGRAVSTDPLVVFNLQAFPRSETVEIKVWDRDLQPGRVAVRDDAGNVAAGQVVNDGDYWDHKYTTIIFPAKDIPAMGYRTYSIDSLSESVYPVCHEEYLASLSTYEVGISTDPVMPGEVKLVAPGIMENDFVRVEVDTAAGAVRHLIDKSTGYDYVPEDELMGVLELYLETPHNMSAWEIGQIQEKSRLTTGGFNMCKILGYELPLDNGVDWMFGKREYTCGGPHRAAVRIGRRMGDSRIVTEIGLNADSPMVDFRIIAAWREVGTKSIGVPMLKIAFPANVVDPSVTYEIPFGSIQRKADGREVPAQRWADISGKRTDGAGSCGITMVNSSKYGHSAQDNTLRLTLIRSSYEPDPLPETGQHDIRLAVIPHAGNCSVSAATRSGEAFNLPMSTVNTDMHEGDLPTAKGFLEVLNPNIMLAAMKKAEDSDAIILRLYETDGKDTEAQIRISGIAAQVSTAVEVDLMEEPVGESTARIVDEMLLVDIPAHGITSVRVV
ncbi:MAG: glycoside hydrolase family 38 C-terminal domain-containing protein [bacterium]|nr:glycoside hydrolase family 38 C-terminal domain-containing protein [bacterium]